MLLPLPAMNSVERKNNCWTEFALEFLNAHCRGTDWINKTIKKKRIRQGSVVSLHSKIHEDDNDLIPFIIETSSIKGQRKIY